MGHLAGSSGSVYRVHLRPGEFLHAAIDQQGVDILATLVGPTGQRLVTVDSPNGAQGAEHVFFEAAVAGDYLVEIHSLRRDGHGRYTIGLEVRLATPIDRARAAACRELSRGDAHLARDDAEGNREAARAFERALALWQQADDRHQMTLTTIKLAQAYWRLGEAHDAIAHWERAIDDLRASRLERQEPSLRNDLGRAYQRLGEIRLAQGSFELALRRARQLGDRREETAAINNLALLEKAAGELWRALVMFDEALAGWRELGDVRGEATTLHNLGTLYTVLGRLPEAQDALETALRLYQSQGSLRQEAATAMALGWVRFLLGDSAGGRRDLLRSLELRRRVGDRRGEAVTRDRLGTMLREMGQPQRAMAEYEQALAIFRDLGDRQDEAHTLSNLGEAMTAAGNPSAGLRCLNAALRSFETLGEPSAAAYAHFRRGLARRAMGDPWGARAEVKLALQGLESIREQTEGSTLRASYLASVHDFYELAMDISMELHGRDPAAGFDLEALAIAERARARSLLDLVTETRSRGKDERARLLEERLLHLGREIRAEEWRLRTHGGRDAGTLRSRLRDLLLEREKALVGLRGMVAATDVPEQTLDPAGIQSLLDSDTVLVVFVLGNKRSFVWAVTPSAIESAVLPSRGILEAAAERVHNLFAQSHLVGYATQADLSAREISHVLLGKIAHHLRAKRIAVVPDGALAYLPFAALPEPGGGGRPLVVHHEVVVLPSASVMAAIRERGALRKPAPGLLAVVASPVFDRDEILAPPPAVGKYSSTAHPPEPAASESAVTRSASDLGLESFPRLPFSRREAAAILSLAPQGRTLEATGTAANRRLVTEGQLGAYRILHLATHTLVHPVHPELSGIVLSLYDSQGRPQDGFLHAYEIFDLDLPADLVVVSGCRTGVGQQFAGEGLVGFTQSFFHAGATRLIVSLWDVEDEATARLMESFYKELFLKKRTPAAALRAAQLSMLRDPDAAAPYYWGAFVLQGEWK